MKYRRAVFATVPGFERKRMFRRQQYHGISLVLLLLLMGGILWVPGLTVGRVLGVDTVTWYSITVVLVVMHHVYVWFCWRSELHYQTLTELFGSNGFTVYAVGALFFLMARPILVIVVGVANRNTLWLPDLICWILTAVLALLSTGGICTTLKNMTFQQVLGVDHFYENITKRGLTEEGIFRYVSNPLFTLGMLGMWIPGVIFRSKAALVLGLFQHLYVWVHYLTIERPDIQMLYPEQKETE